MDLKAVNREYHTDAPTAEQLSKIKPGDSVRLGLSGGSLFWCRVIEPRRPSGIFCGVADDTVPPVHRGDRVFFQAEHVFGIV